MRVLRLIAVLAVCPGSAAAQPLAEDHRARERAAVHQALAAVDHWLENSGHAKAWRKRLDTDTLRHELAKNGSGDLVAVERWLERIAADTPIAAHLPPLALRRSVEVWLAGESCYARGRYLPAVAVSILQSPMPNTGLIGTGGQRMRTGERPSRDQLKKHLVALAAMLSRYAEQPTDDLAIAVDQELVWLEKAGRADTLVGAVRRYYGHPNVWIDVSEDLLDDPVVRTIDRREPVRDVILGTPVTGNGRLRATSNLVIQPDSDRAILKIVVDGQVDTQTIGRPGPARIHSRATTTFRAEKRLVIEQTGLRIMPTVCRAQLSEADSDVSAVRGGLRGLLVRRIADRRWQASRGAAHEEARRHVERQVATVVDREADELIGRLDRFAIGPMLLLAKSGSVHGPLRFCGEAGVLRIGMCRGPLGAPPGMPPVDRRRLFAVRVHSSLVYRLAAVARVDAPSRPELTFLTPSKALQNVARLAQPGRLLGAVSDSAPGSSPLEKLVGDRFWQRLAWKWIEQTVAPRLAAGGIVLRDGRWGRLTPGELAGDWPLLGWQPIADLSADLELPVSAEASTGLRAFR